MSRPETDELAALRRRVKAQRAELRRLNKVLGPYWAGFRRGLDVDSTKELRVRMFAAFGVEPVQRAERARCSCVGHRCSNAAGGWWCPLHGYTE